MLRGISGEQSVLTKMGKKVCIFYYFTKVLLKNAFHLHEFDFLFGSENLFYLIHFFFYQRSFTRITQNTQKTEFHSAAVSKAAIAYIPDNILKNTYEKIVK